MLKLFRNIRKNLLVENKTAKYFKYAIGEIVLVVIGILIALSINTWNTERNNHKIVLKNTKSLIANLEKDSIYMENRIQELQTEENSMLRLEGRLSHSEATIDTLVKIVRYEFRPLIPVINFKNENTYKTMVLSGDINLFDSQITEAIYAIYRKQEGIENISESNFNQFIQATQDFQERYSLKITRNTINGHLQDLLWQDVNAKDLIARFNKLTLSKRFHYGRKAQLEDVLKETSALLVALRKIEKQ
tara:strand:+ start:785 stop:1525 length:741 start_codon:yes stop_codon:yes gene_type:complete